MLGGLIAAKWGWKAAFGVVGVPGLLLALLYLKVRDYRTVDLTPELNQATKSTANTAKFIAKALVRSPTMLWVCLGGAAQLVVVSAIWSWLPSFLNRYHGIAPDQAGDQGRTGRTVRRSGQRRLGQRCRPRRRAARTQQAARDGGAVRDRARRADARHSLRPVQPCCPRRRSSR